MTTIISPDHFQRIVNRLAAQLLEDEQDLSKTVFIGLQPRGIFVSDAIVTAMKKDGVEVQYGKLDITFYRDDVMDELHRANKTDISFSVDGKNVVLIDDVLHTGRTVRAALDALMDFGRPDSVKLCVLVNRRHSRELPIQADYFGMAIDTQFGQKVKVNAETGEVVLSA